MFSEYLIDYYSRRVRPESVGEDKAGITLGVIRQNSHPDRTFQSGNIAIQEGLLRDIVGCILLIMGEQPGEFGRIYIELKGNFWIF